MTPTRLCMEPRCPNQVTARGRCDFHRKELERERSARRREVSKGIFKTKRWAMRRRQVISEQPMCAICETRVVEEIDHIVPLSQGGAPYDRQNLRGLCRPCHRERHRPTAA